MKAAYTILVLTISVLLLNGCSKEDETVTNQWVNDTAALYQLNNNKISITEGVAGTLTLSEGNCMPIVDENSTCKVYPVKRTVKVYPYTTMAEAGQNEHVYFTPQAEPVATIESDAEGFYQASLTPGIYSVFIQENGKLYANSFDGQGGINPVQVQQRTVSNLNLKLDYAVY
ncbi:hypothetical protein ACFSKU_01260 [Pontibacter silvestris]|uniref:Carboxypeptidase regulatory-like domain-containing protein n=2 Tax=Pontibacter silvestris TaxID=2305183 RepID=A0ABW4WU90_9BACT